MNEFRQHLPGFVDTDAPPFNLEFSSTEELLAAEWIQNFSKDPTFAHYALSDNTLMAIYDEGFRWWVLGYIREPDRVHLPEWDYGRYLVKFKDGTVHEVSGNEVSSSCGDRITLMDGRVGRDARKDK